MLVSVLAKIEKLRQWQATQVATGGEGAGSGDESHELRGETHGVIEEIAELEHMILTDLARGAHDHDVVNVAQDVDTHKRLEGVLEKAGIDSTVAHRWKR